MPRYIEVDKFERHLKNCICEVENANGCPDDYMIILKALQNASPAEVAPVVHGQWIPDEGDVIFICSICDAEISTDWDYDDENMFRFCPVCGAQMDGEKNG